jgi:hypothetical protein
VVLCYARHTEAMAGTITFYVLVGTIAFGVCLDLGYRTWQRITPPQKGESVAAVLTPDASPHLPVDDA